MILAIDIGNTDVVFGLWDGHKWLHVWRLPTLKGRQAELYYEMRIRDHFLEMKVSLELVQNIILSSVVPDLNPVLAEECARIFNRKIRILGPKIYKQLPIEIPRPREIGSDLVANAFAAWKLYKTNCIVVDFGTALTYTAVTSKGEIVGVSIAPGIKTAIGALSNNTAQLPIVPLEKPKSALGKDTVHAIQAGVLFGYTGMVKYMITSLKEELGLDYQIIATGGLCNILEDLKNDFDRVNRKLTLDGLRFIMVEIEK